MLALLMAWKTLQALFLPKGVTLLGVVSAVFLTIITPNLPTSAQLGKLIPIGELEHKDPSEVNDCYRRLWSTYRFQLARYNLNRGSVAYVTTTMQKDGEIFFVFLNDREDSGKLHTKRAVDKLWLGAFSVNPITGKCFIHGSILGNKEEVHPEPLKAAWVRLLDRLNPAKNSQNEIL